MDINQKMLMELANELGLGPSKQSRVTEAVKSAEDYKNKSEGEILEEIMALKNTMKSDPAQFQKQLTALKALRGMLGQEQKARLDQVLAMLERE